ncbi:MAG: hypothetical protein M1820_007109 [Bogoriella megaspora]|nr:MAG: hypothetical protein M1820_007109 [Bogoriella megaspora]
MTHPNGGSGGLSDYRIAALPPSFFYIPNFITEEEEAQILEKIPPNRWITLTHRRLQTHPSKLSSSNTLLASPLPSFLTTPIIPRFQDLGLFKDTPHKAPNHVLINEYQPGEGIMMHEDGGAYAPVVATVSLGGSLVLDLVEKTEDGVDADGEEGKEGKRWRILQEPRSLLVTTGRGYTDFLHGIAEVERDEELSEKTVINWALLGDRESIEKEGLNVRRTRTSLTYRDVLKISSAVSRILRLNQS